MTEPKVPNTISDERMDSLRRRADRANPHLRKFTSPEAIRQRKQSSEQLRKSRWS